MCVCACLKLNCCPPPPNKDKKLLPDSQPWFLLVVQIPYDSFKFRNQHVFFFCVRTLTSHWISMDICQLFRPFPHATCHRWTGQSFSNPTASWISARTSPTIKATACLQSSSASWEAKHCESWDHHPEMGGYRFLIGTSSQYSHFISNSFPKFQKEFSISTKHPLKISTHVVILISEGASE